MKEACQGESRKAVSIKLGLDGVQNNTNEVRGTKPVALI